MFYTLGNDIAEVQQRAARHSATRGFEVIFSMTFRALCEMPGCKRASWKTLKFAHGAENWFCKACYDWIITSKLKQASIDKVKPIPANTPDANAGDPAKKGD